METSANNPPACPYCGLGHTVNALELIEHLRATAKAWPIGGRNSLTELLEQAANEIERLRQELDKQHMPLAYPTDWRTS